MFIETKTEGEVQLDEASWLLMRAADLIEERGHCKGALLYDGRLCVRGALNFAAHGDPYKPGSLEAVARIRKAIVCGTSRLPDDWLVSSWNDAPERTPAEVISTLRRVAMGEGK